MISVVMPAYNSEKYISQAVDSLIAQTYTDWELLAIDDGSTDGTAGILDSYAQKDERIKVVHTANYGVAHARNVGIEMATGDWLAFLDCDDFLPPNALEALFAASEKMDLVIGAFATWPSNSCVDRQLELSVDNISFAPDSFVQIFQKGLFLIVWNKLYRRSVLSELRFNSQYKAGEDILFVLESLNFCKKVRVIPDNVYYYRRESLTSLSHKRLFYDVPWMVNVCSKANEIYKDNLQVKRLMDSYFAHCLIVYLKAVVTNDGDSAKKKIVEILKEPYFKNIPVTRLQISREEMRVWMLLLTGDFDLLCDALNLL